MEKSYAAKNIVLGLIGLVWGGMVLFNHFTGHRSPPGNASYEAGVTAALVFGGVLFLVGGYTLVRGLTGDGQGKDDGKGG